MVQRKGGLTSSFVLLLVVLIIGLVGCDLGGTDSDGPESSLTPYRQATIDDVPVGDSDGSPISSEDEIADVVATMMSSGMENLGIVMNKIDMDNAEPRSISALFTLNIKDEGFVTHDETNPDTELAAFDIEHLDLEVGLGIDEFMEFVIGLSNGAIDDPSLLFDILFSGKLGFSAFISTEEYASGGKPQVDTALGAFIDLSVKDFSVEAPEESRIAEKPVYNGKVNAKLDFSVATNVLWYYDETEGMYLPYSIPLEVSLSMHPMEEIPIGRVITFVQTMSSLEAAPTADEFHGYLEDLWGIETDDPFITAIAKVGDEEYVLEDFEVFPLLIGSKR